jgi:hypothetical protein
MSTDHRTIERVCPIRRLGHGDRHHFFGYYDKTVWDRSDRRILANRVAMMNADLTPELVAEVGYFDSTVGGSFQSCGTTTAWNWQMGCQLQWLGGGDDPQFIYNIRRDSHAGPYPGFGSAVFNLRSGHTRELDTPIYVAAPDGSFALTVDYSRLFITHETIGYSERGGKRCDMPPCPTDDGIRHVDRQRCQPVADQLRRVEELPSPPVDGQGHPQSQPHRDQSGVQPHRLPAPLDRTH